MSRGSTISDDDDAVVYRDYHEACVRKLEAQRDEAVELLRANDGRDVAFGRWRAMRDAFLARIGGKS